MGRVPAMTVTATVALCLGGVLDASHGVAEESAWVSFKSPAEDKYTQQQNNRFFGFLLSPLVSN
jgi:hypothetical protein